MNERVPILSRDKFLAQFGGDYRPGQHATFLGPTGRGKTYLAHQMLREVISPRHRCVLLSAKPPGRDTNMAVVTRGLNLKLVREWPPPYSIRDRGRNGWVLEPEQGMRDIDADNDNLTKQFKKAMISNYGNPPSKPVITVVDEAHFLSNDLHLKKQHEAPLMRGQPVNACWTIAQRGRYLSYLAYSAPEHVILFHDPDQSNQARYSELGGVDPAMLRALTATLKTQRLPQGNSVSEAIYIKRSGPGICIIEP